MKVFKFGGASVKDAEAVKNVAGILSKYAGEQLVVVISAMGKTTNALERLAEAYFKGDNETALQVLEEVRNYHTAILNGLFSNPAHAVYTEIHNTLVELEWVIEDQPTHDFDCEYDQIVSVGELLSTKIVSHYLTHTGMANRWQDVRDWIKTDNTYREAKVDWALTRQCVLESLAQNFNAPVITQGFLGVTSENFTTTLGRDGSDYSAAILAYCMNAEALFVWKDVECIYNTSISMPGITEVIREMSYFEAQRLTHFGFSVLHPKVIRPLEIKEIPIYIKSYINLDAPGTIIRGKEYLKTPSVSIKTDLCLYTVTPPGFNPSANSEFYHYYDEVGLLNLLELFTKHKIKSICSYNSINRYSFIIPRKTIGIGSFVEEIKEKGSALQSNENIVLITIRHHSKKLIDFIMGIFPENSEVKLQIISRLTAQIAIYVKESFNIQDAVSKIDKVKAVEIMQEIKSELEHRK